MQVELIQSAKGFYQIWTDDQFVKEIQRGKTETAAQYKARSEQEYDNYVGKLKSMRPGGTAAKTVKKTVL